MNEVERFKNVITNAEIGIDPVWLQYAVDRIEQLQHIIDMIIDAPNDDALLDAIGDARIERTKTWGLITQ